MNAKTQLLVISAIMLAACGKKFECEGFVYSRHHVPMPGQIIFVPFETGGKSQSAGDYTVSTNSDGHFVFSKLLRRNLRIQNFIVQNKDSGDGGISNMPVSVNGRRDLEIILK